MNDGDDGLRRALRAERLARRSAQRALKSVAAERDQVRDLLRQALAQLKRERTARAEAERIEKGRS